MRNAAYCYVPGKGFASYGGEQIAKQVETGFAGKGGAHEAVIMAHLKAVPLGAADPANIASLALPRWETPGSPGVTCGVPRIKGCP